MIGRQLALGFGSVSLVAIAMCALLVAVIQEVAGLVESMRHDESSILQGMELSTAVRDMSSIMSRVLVDEAGYLPPTYDRYRDRVRSRIQTLAGRIPAEQQERLRLLGETTQRMHELWVGSLLPAVRRGDATAVQQLHRELEGLSIQAAQHADVLASATTLQMASAHDHATRSTRLGLVGGGLCALLIVALSVAFTLRLRAVVLRPLHRLTDAALRYGRGDFAFRVGDVGKGELAAVGDAFSRMADELARREARLVHNERMAAIGQLAAGIAHELNNPIGIIRGYLKTMCPEEDADTLREELAILDEEAEHCQRIAEDLLSYARAEELSIERLRMGSFLAETAKRYEVGNSAVRVEVDTDDAVVEADGARLRQVVLNLLNNAGQASPEGACVRVHGRSRGERYHIEIVDRGPGVELEDRQRIFEPFFSTRKGGSGLGLAVCQGIVQAHGGMVEVEDAEGGGSLFRIVVPMTQSSSGSGSESSQRERP